MLTKWGIATLVGLSLAVSAPATPAAPAGTVGQYDGSEPAIVTEVDYSSKYDKAVPKTDIDLSDYDEVDIELDW